MRNMIFFTLDSEKPVGPENRIVTESRFRNHESCCRSLHIDSNIITIRSIIIIIAHWDQGLAIHLRLSFSDVAYNGEVLADTSHIAYT